MRERSFTRDADGERLALEVSGVQVRVKPVVSLQRAPHASPGIFALGTRQAAIGMLGVAGDHDVVDQEGEGRIQHHSSSQDADLGVGQDGFSGPHVQVNVRLGGHEGEDTPGQREGVVG